jgi:hypothetical protein
MRCSRPIAAVHHQARVDQALDDALDQRVFFRRKTQIVTCHAAAGQVALG